MVCLDKFTEFARSYREICAEHAAGKTGTMYPLTAAYKDDDMITAAVSPVVDERIMFFVAHVFGATCRPDGIMVAYDANTLRFHSKDAAKAFAASGKTPDDVRKAGGKIEGAEFMDSLVVADMTTNGVLTSDLYPYRRRDKIVDWFPEDERLKVVGPRVVKASADDTQCGQTYAHLKAAISIGSSNEVAEGVKMVKQKLAEQDIPAEAVATTLFETMLSLLSRKGCTVYDLRSPDKKQQLMG